MSEKVELSRQQRKSQETREKIFQAAKKILQKKGMKNFLLKISVRRPEFPMAAFIIISRQKMICCLTILRNSRRSTRICWKSRRMQVV